jgi:hypothetical protein
MTTRSSVPADVEADSIIDLVQDCREISGALGGVAPARPTPGTRGAMPVDIRPEAVRSLAGYDDYGS